MKGQNQNPQNPQKEELGSDKIEKLNPLVEEKIIKLTIKTSSKEKKAEKEKIKMKTKNDQRTTPRKGMVGKERKEKLKRKEERKKEVTVVMKYFKRVEKPRSDLRCPYLEKVGGKKWRSKATQSSWVVEAARNRKNALTQQLSACLRIYM